MPCRFEDANEKLAVCVMLHKQLLGQRHPQLIRPYLAAAENSAKWGDSLGLQGKEQVKKAQVGKRCAQRIFSALSGMNAGAATTGDVEYPELSIESSTINISALRDGPRRNT